MGLFLRAPSHSAPAEHETFLVVDDLLRIRAVSRGAERLLGMHETQLIDSHVGEVLVPAEATPEGSARLAVLVARVASGAERGDRAHPIAVRPRDTYGVRYAARIGPCSPDSAALIVLGDPL
jgi:PAS domain-containing protein